MFTGLQELGILDTFTPLEVVRNQQTLLECVKGLGPGARWRTRVYSTIL